MEYDEEQHLVRIRHSANGATTTAYEYGYAADGGRRWQKDYINNVWTWYPCGVACNAGELVEQTSDLTGNVWTTSALYLKSGNNCRAALIRRNSEYHHFDIAGSLAVITDINAAVLATRVYSTFGVQRFASGNTQTTWTSTVDKVSAEGLAVRQDCIFDVARVMSFTPQCPIVGSLPDCSELQGTGDAGSSLRQCMSQGQKCSKSKGPEDSTRCRGGIGSHYTYRCQKPTAVITVLCCPCLTPKGETSQRCKCSG